MKNKEIKTYLSKAYRINHRINSKLEQISSLHDLATKATSTISDMPGSATRNIHRMEDIIVKIMTLEEEINKDIDELVDLKTDITHLIKQLDNHEYQIILEERYLCFKKFENISVDMGYSIQHIFRLHDQALKELSKFYKSGE